MASIFTQIIAGKIPGDFVWSDDICVAFADINPQTLGHVIVVPRAEIAKFSDLDDATAAHLMTVCRRIAHTQERVFSAVRSLLVIQGYEVAHTHLHVFPTTEPAQMLPTNKIPAPSKEELALSMEKLRAGLRKDGWGQFVPTEN